MNITINNHEYKMRTITEEHLWNPVGVINPNQKINNVSFGPLNYLPKLKITRNLVDDTFDVLATQLGNFASAFNSHLNYNTPQIFCNTINVNNKILEKTSLEGNYAIQQFVRPGEDVKFHRALLENVKLRDTNLLSLTWNSIHSSLFGVPKMAYVLSPRFKELPSSISLNENEVLDIKLIKATRIQTSYHNWFGVALPTKLDKEQFEIKDFFMHYLFVPTTIGHDKFNQNVVEIYTFLDESSSDFLNYEPAVFADNNLKTSEYKSDSQSSKRDLFPSDEDVNKISFSLDGNMSKALHIGNYSLKDSAFYDYKEGKIKLGPNEASQIGDIIPFDFKGDFTQKISLNINAIINQLQLGVVTKVEQSLLDPFDGKITLTIKDSDGQHVTRLNSLSFNDIKSMRKILENGKQISLNGIKRLSNE